MPSQQEVTAFTLSFAGVNFTLEPNTDQADMLRIAKVAGDEILIDFTAFSGLLRVTKVNNSNSMNALQFSEAQQTALTENESIMELADDEALNNERAPPSVLPDAVPEEMPSPEIKVENKEKRKGQQKLDFFSKKKESKATKRNVEPQRVVSSRKKTRKFTKEEEAVEDNEDDESIAVDESQNTKFTLGQDMPSQESGEEDMTAKRSTIGAAASETSPKPPGENMDSLDHDNFSFNMDDFSTGEDDFFKNKLLTPLKEDIVAPIGTLTPCARWGQSMTMIDHRRLVVYGGQTVDPVSQTPMPLADLFVYDLFDHTWTKPINCDGVARTWHTANFLPEKQLLLCFGGDVVDEKGKTTTTDQVMVLDTEIMLWYPPSVSGQVPSGRSGHTASLLSSSNELVVFGGVKNGKWLNSVSVLDAGRWKWYTPKIVGDAPRPRSYHSSTSLSCSQGSRVVVFGGNNDTTCFNCVHVLEQVNGIMTWSHPKVNGKAPSPRTGHTATLLEDGYTIMIYGGWDPNTEDEKGDDLIFGDSFLLDTKTWTWSKGPKPKYASFNGNAANGGLERVGHSAVLAPGGDGVQVLAFGGRLRDGFAADFQSLLPAPQPVQRETSSRRKSGGES
ncbi:hypothetical protein ACHAXN_010177 [Cyclotella atomus]